MAARSPKNPKQHHSTRNNETPKPKNKNIHTHKPPHSNPNPTTLPKSLRNDLLRLLLGRRGSGIDYTFIRNEPNPNPASGVSSRPDEEKKNSERGKCEKSDDSRTLSPPPRHPPQHKPQPAPEIKENEIKDKEIEEGVYDFQRRIR